ncbi:sigma-54 dependent transcriptional regulator [Flavobacterium cucumis]|uniref:Two-component system, NtrC family, response regulator HydG n=2 Tax=Flavobacterium cucumis TaxID=416016 RepID=A0A1M7ZUR9_9FLAO|nr:two-component system, NtrC family, response regulator HydG [Flavobacterium cucumis]
MGNATILLIEDDNAFNNMLAQFLKRNDYIVHQAYSAKEGITILDEKRVDIIISDLRLPDKDGISLLKEIRTNGSTTAFILMTAYADVQTAVKAMKMGAADYISKPFVPEEALLVLNKIISTKKEASPSNTIKKTAKELENSNYYWGNSIASLQLKKHIELVAPTPLTLLITGESGTGKEVIAKTIHENSERKNGPFIAVDCGAIPKDIAGSEFFGHVKGSFTGAITDKMGCFEAANGGTLFLDEVGNLAYENQILLLRAIQERKIKRIGSNKETPIDVRIVSATNEDLKKAVQEGTFREDLYHRLNEFSILSPALRDRKEDLEAFALLFLKNASEQLNKDVSSMSSEVMIAFLKYHWPGNLRELQNVIKRATLLNTSNTLELESLPPELTASNTNNNNVGNLKDEAEKAAILDALNFAKGNKSRAAELLGMSRKTLYNKISQFGLDD